MTQAHLASQSPPDQSGRGPLTIGTRGSALALAQAGAARQRLADALGLAPEALPLEVIRTSGDKILDKPLYDIGGKGLFTKEIEEALRARRIDLAVHSLKDVPSLLTEEFALPAILEREDARDALISKIATNLDDLPAGARIGTSSPRRRALVKRLRPDLIVVDLRGNVDTRMSKVIEGELDAVLLAMAGLNRLGRREAIIHALDPTKFPPAGGQGAVAIESRADDPRSIAKARLLDHAETRARVLAERAFLGVLDGSCRTAIAAHARIEGDRLRFDGHVMTPEGDQIWHEAGEVPVAEAEALGLRLGQVMKDRLPAGVL